VVEVSGVALDRAATPLSDAEFSKPVKDRHSKEPIEAKASVGADIWLAD